MAYIDGKEILFSTVVHGASAGGGDITIEAVKEGTVTTLTITDSAGTQRVTINDGADGKNGYSIFTADMTITEISTNNAVVDIAMLNYFDTRGFQIGDLILDTTNGNLWRIVGQSVNQLAVTLVSNLKGTDGTSVKNITIEEI